MAEKAHKEYCKLKYCTNCQYVWEDIYCTSNRMRRIYKYKELCSYKLDRETCAECERGRNANVITYNGDRKLETRYC